MKKIILITLALMLVCAPALAAGKLTVNQERMIAVDNYGSVYVYVFAEVENTGDKPVEFSAGLVELFDAEGDTIDSTDYIYCDPPVLAPGGKGYVNVTLYPDNAALAADVADYMLTVTGKSSTEERLLYKATGTYEEDVADGYWTYDYLTAEITNETDEAAYDIDCVFAVKDADGALLYVTSMSSYSIGIPAGSAMLMRTYMPDSMLEWLDANGLSAASLDVIAYDDSY